MKASSSSLVEALEPIGLEELTARASLQDRVDTKYLVEAERLRTLLERLAASHRVLEIDGRRVFTYRTTYYDSPELVVFREHLQGRRRRYKIRKRRYLDSGFAMLELKLKGLRGRTVKHALVCSADERLEADEGAWLRGLVSEAYGRDPATPLGPSLTIDCRRITLAAPALGERVTCDVAVDFDRGGLREGLAIVESKSEAGDATADRILRDMGARPTPGCSKYCVGIALSENDVKANPLLPLLRRYFTLDARV